MSHTREKIEDNQIGIIGEQWSEGVQPPPPKNDDNNKLTVPLKFPELHEGLPEFEAYTEYATCARRHMAI